jgi:hypothetical protein
MDRAMAHTLEAFTAALLVVSGVVFALQATAVTPLTASTSNQHVENQQQATAADLLAAGDAEGSLRTAVLYWNASGDRFAGASEDGYRNGGPPTALGAALNETFGNLTSGGGRVAYDVFVDYRTPGGDARRQTMVYMGSPSDNAVVATRTVAVFDGDRRTAPGANGTVADGFYAPDAAPNATLYNVLEVHVVVWKM